MQFKDLVVHLSPCPGAQVAHGGQYAIGLARAHDARVTALVYEISPRLRATPGATDPAPAAMAALQREVEQTAAAFAARAAAAAVACETVAERSYAYGIGEVFADYGRVRDLAVLGTAGPLSLEQRFLVEAALFHSGRPLILVPEHAGAFAQERVVVAWDATPAAVHALAGAMPILQAAREVTLLSVPDDKEIRPGESGSEMCRHLARHGVNATFEKVARSGRPVAAVLLESARARSADLLVMGAYAHSTLRGLVFGSATRGIVETALPLPVLLAH